MNKKQGHNRRRRIRYTSRKQVENRLTKQYGGTPTARKRALAHMKGKHVHKTKAGLKLISPSEHAKKHGRGNKGPSGSYTKSSKLNKKGT